MGHIFFTFVIFIFCCDCEGCPCGRRHLGNNPPPKIVGGSLSKQNAYPWTAALVYQVGNNRRIEQFCGASVIDNIYVLTAAHCVSEILSKNPSFSNYKVLVGDTRLNGSNILQLPIAQIKIHPNYNPKNLGNDIALIRLSQRIVFSKTVQPICLHQPTGQQLTTQTMATVVGAVRDDGPTVNSQREVQVRIVPVNNCKTSYNRVGVTVTPQTMLCASSNQKDSCSGDSGGPLFIKREKKGDIFEQIGIVSFGRGCAQKSFPGVYTKVSTFKNFILQNTKDAEKC